MDFLKALAEAQQQGFTKKEFTNIWEVETKIVQMKEESKLMELKLEYEKLPVKETGSEITKQQLDSIVQQHCMEHQKQLLELKEECHKQNELHTKKISKLLETQASLVALVIRNETEAVLKQFPNSKSKAPPESNAHAGFVKSSNPGLPQNDTQRQQQSKNKDQPQMQVPSEKMRKIDEDLDSMIPRLPQDGAEFHVESLSSIVLSRQVQFSPLFVINECLSKVRLSLWFNESAKLNVRCTISELSLRFFQPPKIFKCFGYIKNRNSQSYSSLFEGESQSVQCLQTLEKKEFPATVCLKTGRRAYQNVTFHDLDARGYVFDDMMHIKWLVTSRDEVAKKE